MDLAIVREIADALERRYGPDKAVPDIPLTAWTRAITGGEKRGYWDYCASRLYAEVKQSEILPAELDEYVHRACERTASGINNGGEEEQVDFLIRQEGIIEVVRIVKSTATHMEDEDEDE